MLAGYTFAYARLSGAKEGFLTVALAVLCFIFKKTLLAFTDDIGIDSAIFLAGALFRLYQLSLACMSRVCACEVAQRRKEN